MNNKQRYEEALSEQLNNLPIPDEDLAWADMKKLLEEDDEDSIIVPPPIVKGCGLWGILLFALLLAGGIWYFMHTQKNKNVNTLKSETANNIKNNTANLPNQTNPNSNSDLKNNQQTVKINADTTSENYKKKNAEILNQKKKYTQQIINANPISDNAYSNKKASNKYTYSNNPINTNLHKSNKKNTAEKSKINITNGNLDNVETSAISDSTEIIKTINNKIEKENTDSSNLKLNKKTDSLEVKKKNASPEDSVATKQNTLQKNKGQHFYFAAGIALQQSIPIEGAKAVPYNYFGRKGSLADYIPSLYVRLYRTNKWFIQSEFKYGAPHYTKEFTYKTEVLDTVNQTQIKAFYRLKKTYYHQLPLSFNYMILPNLSLGTGIVFNKFYAAISQQDIHKKTPFTNDTLLSSKIIGDKADSNFTKNLFHWMIETQYQWKRFYFGARFTMGLQPYIRFIDDATGLPVQKKDLTFNIFLRYELWNSKKKK